MVFSFHCLLRSLHDKKETGFYNIKLKCLKNFSTILIVYNFTDLSGGIIMPVNWKSERQYQDIMYQTYKGIAKISINRPQVHNAFTPKTVME